MEARGYVEGPSLVSAYRSAEGRTERFAELTAELVRPKVDLIFTRGTLAAKRATQTIPIVYRTPGSPTASSRAPAAPPTRGISRDLLLRAAWTVD